MIKEKTGVQLNAAHTHIDDFITKKYVLPLLMDEETRNRLIAEHKATPVGRAPHKGIRQLNIVKTFKLFLTS